jgi:hypothetical protein
MSEENNQDKITKISAADIPSTSAKESNENDIQMKFDPLAFKEKDHEIASEKLRYDNADEIYPD